MTQLFSVSTMLGGMAAAAAIDAGLAPAPRTGERLLVVCTTNDAPELVTPWYRLPAAAPVLARFDRVIDMNEELAPFHPSRWLPADDQLPLLARTLKSHWAIVGPDPIELFVESIDEAPASTLVRLLRGGPVTVVSAGLATYGPTPAVLPLDHIQRLSGLLFLDLLQGVQPVLLSEHGIASASVPADALRSLVDEMVRASEERGCPLPRYDDMATALVLGQRFSDLGILTPAEESVLNLDMVGAAIERGAQRVAFKPDPLASPFLIGALRAETERRGAEFALVTDPVSAEMIAAATPLACVVSCCSTGLVTLSRLYGVPAVSVGCPAMLARLKPLHHAMRTRATVVDAMNRPEDAYRDPSALTALVQTVAFCMQPRMLPGLRPIAESLLAQMSEPERDRYFTRRRLTDLGLPGAVVPEAPPAPRPPKPPLVRLVRGAKRRVRAVLKALRG